MDASVALAALHDRHPEGVRARLADFQRLPLADDRAVASTVSTLIDQAAGHRELQEPIASLGRDDLVAACRVSCFSCGRTHATAVAPFAFSARGSKAVQQDAFLESAWARALARHDSVRRGRALEVPDRPFYTSPLFALLFLSPSLHVLAEVSAAQIWHAWHPWQCGGACASACVRHRTLQSCARKPPSSCKAARRTGRSPHEASWARRPDRRAVGPQSAMPGRG